MEYQNKDLSIIFGCIRKSLGKKIIRKKLNENCDNSFENDYLHEVTWSPGSNSVSSTKNFFNSDNSNSLIEENPNEINQPEDKYNLIYFCLILTGLGFLLPYNSFVIAVDYFQDHFPNTTIIFDISTIYIIIQFIAVCINSSLVNLISFKSRIYFGYFITLTFLIVVLIFEITLNLFISHNGYTLNLICVAIIAFGCTIQQSSIYGFSSMLPKKYVQGVMVGESAAGFFVSISRILTKFFIKDEQLNTIIFFLFSILIIFICCLLQKYLQNHEFVKFHLNNCEKSKINLNSESILSTTTNNTNLRNSINENNIELVVTLNQAGTKLQQNVPKSESTEFDLPFGIDEDELIFYVQPNQQNLNNDEQNIDLIEHHQTNDLNEQKKLNKINRLLRLIKIFVNFNLKKGLIKRMKIINFIWPYMLSICLTYLITLSLFPGIESEIENCFLKTWTPIILMFFFNLFDLIGKCLSKFMFKIKKKTLIIFSVVRFVLIPLFILCTVPIEKPILDNFIFILIFTIILGITNGIFGSLPIILAPNCVSNYHKELTGNLMTFSCAIGLIIGSLFSYLIEKLISHDYNFYSKCHST